MQEIGQGRRGKGGGADKIEVEILREGVEREGKN